MPVTPETVVQHVKRAFMDYLLTGEDRPNSPGCAAEALRHAYFAGFQEGVFFANDKFVNAVVEATDS